MSCSKHPNFLMMSCPGCNGRGYYQKIGFNNMLVSNVCTVCMGKKDVCRDCYDRSDEAKTRDMHVARDIVIKHGRDPFKK